MNRSRFLKQSLLASSALMAGPVVGAPTKQQTNMESNITGANDNNICATCGTRYHTTMYNPDACPVCLDDRQYIGTSGQQWTSYAALSQSRSIRFQQLQPRLYDLRITPAFAIGQKVHLVFSPSGNILWDCLPYIDAPTIAFIQSLGGLKAIAISHPHYYSLMAEWAQIFKCPIYLHSGDQQWVMDKTEQLVFWEGREKTLWDGIKIVHTGGHFDGSTVLHLPRHGEQGTLLTGDSIYVSRDGKQVSAMYSYPNMIPLGPKAIRYLVQQVAPLSFNSLFGAFEWMNIPDGAYAIFQRSMQRYTNIITGS